MQIKDSKGKIKELLEKITNEDHEIDSFLYINEKASGDGIPIAIKDAISTKGMPTTAASKILDGYIPPYNATVIDKLIDNGYVIVGKTNMDEFAMGSSTENSGYKITKNPVDNTRVPGGSSGGSAAAVAAGFVPVALGTDTGGSIRQPASFCGVVGFCPSYGAVSRYGVIAMASSFDQVGVLSNTVSDAHEVFDVIRGKDKKDATSFDLASNSSERGEKDNILIGVPEGIFEGVSDEVKESIDKAVESLKKEGIKFVEIPSTNLEQALAVYYIVVPSEVSSNLARYDGVRYGKRVDSKDLIELYSKTRAKYLGDEAQRRTIIGTYALSSGYFDAYYKKANMMREQIKQYYNKQFESVDLILTPTTPTTAFKIGEVQDALTMYLADIFTIPTKLAGLPAISLPVKSSGLPVGMQLIANHKQDLNLLKLSKEIEKCLAS